MTDFNSQNPRQLVDDHSYAPEQAVLDHLIGVANLDTIIRDRISNLAVQLVKQIRAFDRPGLMEVFLAEYGLSTKEGVALMCLAEALLRVPDAVTIDTLIEDKIAPSNWGKHMGHSTSPLVNASTWALMLTGKVLTDDQKKLGVCLIDIGGGTSDVAIFSDGAISHTVNVPIAGTHVTNDIARAIQTSIQNAEDIKKKHGCAWSELADPDEMITTQSINGRENQSFSRHGLSTVIEERYQEIFQIIKQRMGNINLAQAN